MAEQRHSPLLTWAGRLADVTVRSGGRLALVELPFLPQVNVRVDATRCPDGPAPNTVVRWDGCWVLWLGPDEWLIVGDTTGGDPAGVVDRLRTGGALLATVDVSANRTTLVVAGPEARQILAHGCALDLHPGVFGPGRCAQTMVAHAQVVLWRYGPDEFRLLVRPSFAGYLAQWLLDAAVELTHG